LGESGPGFKGSLKVKGDVGSKTIWQYSLKEIGFLYAKTAKTRCPPASPEPRNGGQAPGALHHVMGRVADVAAFLE